MNGHSNDKLGSGRSSQEDIDLMSSPVRNSSLKDRTLLASTSIPYRTHVQNSSGSGTNSIANKSSSSKYRRSASGNSHHRATPRTSSGRTLKRKPSLNVDLGRDSKGDAHDGSVSDDWFDSQRPTSNEPLASTSTTASASVSAQSSSFRPKRARPLTPLANLSKSETESEDDESNTDMFLCSSASPSRPLKAQLQDVMFPRRRSPSPSNVQTYGHPQAATSFQDKGKGKVLTDHSPVFEEDDWCCSICQDVLVGASVLGACGHEYCGKCIWEYIKAGNTQCAICRVKMTEPKAVVLYKLNELVEKWAEKTLRGKEKENWEIRKDEWLAYKFSLADEEAAALASKNARRAHHLYPLNNGGAPYDDTYMNSYDLESGMIRYYQDEQQSDTVASHRDPFGVRSHHAFPPLGPPISQHPMTNNFGASSASTLALPISQRIPRANHNSSAPSSSWSDRPRQRRPPSNGFLSANILHQPNTGVMPSRSHSSSSVWSIRPSAYASSIGPHRSTAVYSSVEPTSFSSSSSSSSTRQSQSSRLVQPGLMSAPARRARSQATPEVVDLTAD